MRQLMNNFAKDHPVGSESEGPGTEGGWNALAYFRKLSLEGLATASGLTKEQYVNLLATPNIDRAMAWVMHGVGVLRK